MTAVTLPGPDRRLETYRMREPVAWAPPPSPPTSRVVYAAAHVVADPLADHAPGSRTALDWDATLRFRRHLWSYGLRVADAMDTAQRNMGLDWTATTELIRRSAAEARGFGDPADLLACGAGTDHLPQAATLEEVVSGYLEQMETVQDAGARVVVMASRQLARLARGPEDYHKIYGRLLGQADRPVILHWLGEMFDPALAGYWGSRDLPAATEAFLALVHDHASRVDGVKVSLLDAEHEVRLRERLPDGVRLYTGDDFNYPELIAGGSHALLGIFDPIAPAAAAALQALDAGDRERFETVLAPTVPLARKIFEPPTYHYKTGIVLLAWLAGHQDAFVMVNGAHSARSILHLAEVFRLADQAGLLPDPDLAAARMRHLLNTAGVAA
ncbi:dihydrodipicolinate synthase family protein [Microbispora sp. H10885]|uniref:dihydrodipicolinate synthase family protein n=1 Tax=Microbispora sp. H10885 TaxID=2729110 RepID=UPI001601DBF8|nr:dihydrodipicolinate synthase family protein [Microbispora sp. H10885]